MEFTAVNKTNKPFSSARPVTREGKGKMIFKAPDFLEIYNRLAKIKPDAQSLWGKMNVVQMLNHLKVATGSGLKAYDLKDESSFLSRVIAKFIALRLLKQLPKNVKGPKGFEIEMNNDLDFNTEKEQTFFILKKAHTSTFVTYIHPMFGTMSRAQWGRLIYRHFDHHLHQFGF